MAEAAGERPGASASALAKQLLRSCNVTVCAVLFVFVYLYCVVVACVILPWLSWSVPGVANLLALTGSTGIALFCYVSCLLQDPGRVPHGWSPDAEQAVVREVKKKGGAPRYCNKCACYKPPRAHHCRVCERCVLRMDHHCVFVNNCIGHANYRNFFLLLIYASAALTQAAALLLSHCVHIVQSSKSSRVVRVGLSGIAHVHEASSNRHLMLHLGLQTAAMAIALPASIAVTMLLVWHLQMVAANKTTIEHAEGVTAQIKASAAYGSSDAGDAAAQRRHPYDLGLCGNLHSILGDPASWCLPACRGTEGGLSFPTVFDSAALDLGF